MVCCCISCKAGPCSQGWALPEPCRAGGGCAHQPGCHRPQLLPPALQSCWGGQWWPSSPGPVPTRSLQTWDSVLATVTAPESWAQLPVLQAGTQLRAAQPTKPGGLSPPCLTLEGLWLTQLGTGIRPGPWAQRAPAAQRERSGLCPWHPAPSPHRPLSPSLLLGQCQILTQLCLRTRPKSLCFCSASMSRSCWGTHRPLSGTGTLLCHQVCAQAQFLCPALPSEFCSMIP